MSILDTVDELTKERKDHIVPKNDDGTLGKAQKITVKPLIVQIREATYPSGEQNGGSTGLDSTRAPIDFSALELYAEVTSWVRAWCVLAGLETTNDPTVDLRRWWVMFDSFNPTESDIEKHHRVMRDWVRRIKDFFDPPVTFDADDPCPICGATEWGDPFNGGGAHPIRVQYRKIDGAMRDERALCRACQVVWDGHEAVTELGEELAEKRGATRGTA